MLHPAELQIRQDRNIKKYFGKNIAGIKKNITIAPDSTRLASRKNCDGSFFLI